jgi:hypothetical protein
MNFVKEKGTSIQPYNYTLMAIKGVQREPINSYQHVSVKDLVFTKGRTFGSTLLIGVYNCSQTKGRKLLPILIDLGPAIFEAILALD